MKKKSWWSRFISPTPKRWRSIRNTSGALLASIVAMGGVSATIPNVITPEWFTVYAWYVGAALAATVTYAQSKEERV